MSGVNKAIIIGNLGRDPEVRDAGGQAVANFTVATSEKWTDKQSGEAKEKTEWHRIVAWGKLAELCDKYLAKGRQVYIEGKLQTRKWRDKNGDDKYTTEIVAQNVTFLGGNPNSRSQASNKAAHDAGWADDGFNYGPPMGGKDVASDRGPPPMSDDQVPF